MKIKLSETEKVELKKLQHQLGDKNLYIKVTILLMLDKGRNIQIIAEDLGIDDGTIYRYISNFQNNGLDKYLFTEHKGYWGLLSSEQISRLSLSGRLNSTFQNLNALESLLIILFYKKNLLVYL